MSEQRIGTGERPLRVAIVGSGPAGFYAADALLSQKQISVEVDMYDRLPTPYGLVRGGVAPDHQKIKSVINVYERSAQHANFRFFGNVMLGRDLQVGNLTSLYDQIVYAVGNEADRRLGIPGEYLLGVTPATVFVGWYNGHPDYRDAKFDFSAESVVVIGNGNVAVDVVRILARDIDDLMKTDIAEHALRQLKESRVREITMVGRRGPVQAAFTPAELKELGELHGADPVVPKEEITLDDFSDHELERAGESSAKWKNFELLKEFNARGEGTKPRKIRFKFFASPVEFLGDDEGCLRAIRMEKNEFFQGDEGTVSAQGTGHFFELPAQMALVAIGYQGKPLPGVPFDEKRGIISNREGRVAKRDGDIVPCQYVVGWAKSGPKGLIGMHRQASAAVVKLMFEDLAKGKVPVRPLKGREATVALLEKRGIDYVTFDDWKILDQIEVNRGARRGAPRIKFTHVDDMLSAVGRKNDREWR